MLQFNYCDIDKRRHWERGEWPTFFGWMKLVSSCNKSLTSMKKLSKCRQRLYYKGQLTLICNENNPFENKTF